MRRLPISIRILVKTCVILWLAPLQRVDAQRASAPPSAERVGAVELRATTSTCPAHGHLGHWGYVLVELYNRGARTVHLSPANVRMGVSSAPNRWWPVDTLQDAASGGVRDSVRIAPGETVRLLAHSHLAGVEPTYEVALHFQIAIRFRSAIRGHGEVRTRTHAFWYRNQPDFPELPQED